MMSTMDNATRTGPERDKAASNTALVLAAHGDRGDWTRNRWLAAHAEVLAAQTRHAAVVFGVLKGEPSLEHALGTARASGAARIAVYPLFMSEGYFVGTVLAGRVAAADVTLPVTVLPPLGRDPALPDLVLAESLKTAEAAGYAPASARLLVVGHGSKFGPVNAEAARKMAKALERAGRFGSVDTAFLEEAPFLADALKAGPDPTVAAGFFSGEGMHAGGDVPDAIAAARAAAAYTGAIGVHAAIPGLIAAAVARFTAGGT